MFFFFQKKILKHSFFWFFDIAGVRECERVGGKEDETEKAIFEITEWKIFWCWFRLLFCDFFFPPTSPSVCVSTFFHKLCSFRRWSHRNFCLPLSRKPFETSRKKKTNSLKHFFDLITFTNSQSESLLCKLLPSNLGEVNFAGDLLRGEIDLPAWATKFWKAKAHERRKKNFLQLDKRSRNWARFTLKFFFQMFHRKKAKRFGEKRRERVPRRPAG